MQDENDVRPVDEYTDSFLLNLGPFGCTINFGLSLAMPEPPGGRGGETVATIRMSLEHLKVMTFLLRHQLIEYERASGTRIAIPRDVLNQLQIGPEDWQECWREQR